MLVAIRHAEINKIHQSNRELKIRDVRGRNCATTVLQTSPVLVKPKHAREVFSQLAVQNGQHEAASSAYIRF